VSSSYLHSLDGRLRIKVLGVRAAPEHAARLEEQFAGVAGMRQVQANPVTGNVLFMYDPSGIRQRDIMKMLQRLGWVSAAPAPSQPPVARVAHAAHADSTGHRILEKLITALLEIVLLRLLHLA